MQGQHSHDAAYYRCRYPKEYALANHVRHPANVLLREDKILPVLDTWLVKVFAPHRIREMLHEMAAVQAASAPAGPSEPDTDAAAVIAECDAKLEKYRAALEAGVDPETVGARSRSMSCWTSSTCSKSSGLRRAASTGRRPGLRGLGRHEGSPYPRR
jgi:hypothetical protein